MQLGYSFADAASHFSMLTVGDGIVSQVPALIISTATGIIVTRAASNGNLSSDITTQLFPISEDAICHSRDHFLFRLIHTYF